VQHGEDATNFLIDVNNYYENQMEKVRANARMLAQRARLFKHDVELPPQSAYERLVVHELFADDPEIGTESAGEGKFRHIVLKYKVGSPTV
jgi:spoIIIJ-associated protein